MPIFDPSQDFAVIDGLSGGVLYRRATDGSFDAGTICPNALGRQATREDLLSAGLLANQIGTIWHLWKADTGLPSPKVGDVIADPPGTRWSIAKVEGQTFSTRFRLTTIKER